MIKDKKHIYEIIVAKKGKMQLSENELKFGPKLMIEKDELFYEKWEREIESLENISNQLKNHKDQTRYNEIQAQIKQIKEVL